jgi:hypothetical protein
LYGTPALGTDCLLNSFNLEIKYVQQQKWKLNTAAKHSSSRRREKRNSSARENNRAPSHAESNYSNTGPQHGFSSGTDFNAGLCYTAWRKNERKKKEKGNEKEGYKMETWGIESME